MKTVLILTVTVLILCMLSGCGSERSEIRLGLYWDHAEDPDPVYLVRLIDGFNIVEHRLDAERTTLGPLRTSSAGTIRVEFVMLQDGVPTGTSGVLELPLKKDWRWGVDLCIAVDDPVQICFGCMGSESFDLDPVLGYDEEKSLFVVWGGNSISNPVIY